MTGKQSTPPDGPDAFPTGEDLPDDPMTVDDIDPFDVDDDGFEDIDEFAAEEWRKDTTADERTRTVINRTTLPKSAGDIADTALVSETKARTTLNKLAKDGIVRSHQTNAGTLYERDPEWHLLKQIRQLTERDSLVDQIQRVKQEIAEYKTEYDTADPDELLVSDTELNQEELEDVSHWRTACRELSHLRAAYRLKEAKEQANTVTVPRDRQSGSHNQSSVQ
jgi:hypothetical protein